MTDMHLDDILEHLADGEWHTVEDIYAKLDISTDKIYIAIRFLSQYHLITVKCNEEDVIQMVRLSDSTRAWYTTLTEMEKRGK